MPLTFHRRPGLVAYVTCGDPSLETSRAAALAAVEAGAEVIELGVPFSDPVADGPIIQRAAERALRNGVTLRDVLQIGTEIRQDNDRVGIIAFSYLNPILRFGLERFCEEAARAGLDGALITDLPVEEAGEYLQCMHAHRLAPVFLAAPTSSDDRLRRIAKSSAGFVYAVSRTGVTGTRDQLPDDALRLVKRIRRHSKLPVAVGFGISTPEQFARVGEYADAAVVGSAIVRTIAENPGREAAAVRDFVTGLVGRRAVANLS
jgi:tryptophan synthase alpha chain